MPSLATPFSHTKQTYLLTATIWGCQDECHKRHKRRTLLGRKTNSLVFVSHALSLFENFEMILITLQILGYLSNFCVFWFLCCGTVPLKQSYSCQNHTFNFTCWVHIVKLSGFVLAVDYSLCRRKPGKNTESLQVGKHEKSQQILNFLGTVQHKRYFFPHIIRLLIRPMVNIEICVILI